MDKWVVIIIALVAVSVIFFALQIGVQQKVEVWPINQITEYINQNNIDIGTESQDSNSIGEGGSQSADGERVSGGGSAPVNYDADGDGFLSCELIASGNYAIDENYLEINYGKEIISFNFERVPIDNSLHPDNIQEVNLRYNLYPSNPDRVIYANIFLADDDKLYVCY